jgi:hypothetical protein
MLSERVATHFTGRRRRRAAQNTNRSPTTRRPEHQRVVGERSALEPEAAADVGRDRADLRLRHMEDVRHLHARAVRILRAGVERVAIVGGAVVADGDARLHRHGREAVVLDAQLHHVLGLGEGGVGRLLVAEHQPEAGVALRAIVPHLHGAILGGLFEIDHRRQRLVVDLDQLGGVARLGERLGDDEGDAVADEAYLVGDQYRLKRAMPLGRAEVLGHQVGGEAAELVGRRIGAGEHREHAGRGLGLGGVDALDAGVRVRRQHGDPVAHAGQGNVIDVAPEPLQEALVFHAPHSLSDAELGHVRLPLFPV